MLTDLPFLGGMPLLLVTYVRVKVKSEWRAYSLAAYGGMPHLLVS